MTPAAPADADAVEGYLAELAAALHGPRKARARLIEEMRGDLGELVDALVDGGMRVERAREEAVREFGDVAAVAAACQEELTVAQARHTASAVVVAVPVLLAGWSALRPDEAGQPAQIFAFGAAATAVCAALLAVVVLVATGSRALPAARPLPRLMAWAGTAAAASIVFGTVALGLTAQGPTLALVAVAAALGHGKVAASARRCRDCASLATA
ncbi:permease prefix domain 1-containing protein [Actinocorallia sp. A-T 12471]|uniref:permease prefix domain 1-containing protein n=1 Tax=Actinocorallia sp. A-T 12471 TaxID=3089813 RepID=UPI0029CCC0D4|nr:permease prefix domain 1-containing protein [Actinocorallia sp. A-T 12471]MDX6739421.1 permease prefix domain 1-containing protein [Actinocorallia sp. A-T 12471]